MPVRGMAPTARLDQIALHGGLGGLVPWLGVLFREAPRPAAVRTAAFLAAMVQPRRG